MRVFLDTSFLIEMAKRKVDGFTMIEELMDRQAELCTVKGVWDELELLGNGASKDAQVAKLALAIAKGKNLKTVRGFFKRHPDDALLSAAQGGAIATQDKGLKARAREAGTAIVTIRQGSHVVKE